MKKISWIDRVRTEAVLRTIKGERNILHSIKMRKAKQIDLVLRRNCFLQYVIEGKVEGTTGGIRRRKQLLDDFKEMI